MEDHRFGWVALLGPPNAGKSTLLNSMIGEKIAIVSPRPQTTRNQISGILTMPQAQIVFLDTPGVHSMRGKLNRFLVEAAWRAMGQADVIVVLADAELYARKPQFLKKDLASLAKPTRSAGRPVLVVLNKVDLVRDKARLLPVMSELGTLWEGSEVFPISALTREGLDPLLARVVSLLPPGPAQFPEDQLSTLELRFMASEIIREKLFLSLREELPYQTAVEIEEWQEEESLTRISATIYVGRPGHKGMVIGKGGENLRRIGTEARLEIEELAGRQVFLQLWVKVREGWTEDQGFLRSLGLGE